MSHQSFSRAAELNKQAGVYSKKKKQASGLALVSFGLLETKAQLRVCDVGGKGHPPAGKRYF